MSAIAESSFTSTSSSTRRTRSSLMLRSDAAEQDDDSILAPPRPTAPTSNDTTTSTASIPQNTTTTTTSSSQQPTRPQETLSKNVAGYAAKQASRVGFGKRTGPSFNISIAKRSLAPASQVSSHTPILSPQPSPAVPSSSAGSFQAPPPLKPASIAKPAEATTTSKTSPVVTMMDDRRPSKMPSSTTMPPAAVMIASTTAPSNTGAPPKRRHHLPHCSRRRPRGPSSQKAQEEEADCGRRSGANTPQTSCAATAGTSHDMMSCGASPCTVTATHEFNSCFSYSDHLHSASGLTASNVGATFMDSSAAAENNEVTLEQINRRTPPQKKQMMMCENTNNNIALTPNSNTSIASWSSHCTECDGAWEFAAAAAATTTTAGAAFGGVSGGGDAECLSPQLTSSCADASSAAFPTSSSSAAASVATTATNTTSGDVKSKTMKKNTNTTTKTRKRRDEHMPLSIPSEKARIALESNARWYQSYTQKIRKQQQSSSPSSRNRKVSCCAESEDEPNQERGVSQLLFHRCNTAPIVSVAFNSSLSSHSTTVSANSTNGIAGTTPDRTEGMQSRQISDSDFIPQSPAPGTTGVTWGDATHAAAFGDAPMTSDHGGFGQHQHHQPHHQPTMEESAMYRMSNECTASRLLPQLYLGGYSDTQYVSLMERFLVTRILSVAKECIPMDIEELDSSSTLKKEKVALEKIDLFSVTKSVVEACGVDTREQHQAFADSTNVVSCDHCVFGAQWIGPKDQAHAIRAVVAEWNAACAANPHQEANISSIVNPALVLIHPDLATRVFLASDGHGSIFSTLHVPMVDHSDEDIGRWFEVCSDYIQDGACRGEATMVHCKMGISRSAATCMAYLMKYGIREKKVRDGFNFNLDTGGGRDLGYRGGRSLVKYRSMGTSSMLWNRTQTMGPGSPDTPTDVLSTSNNSNASPATKSRTASLYQQVPQPNPLIEAVSKVGGDSRVWEVATSVISDMFFNCPECASRGLVNVTYVNLHPLEAMQQYSRLSGASSLVSKSTSESFTGFVPVISNKKTVSDSLRRDLSAASPYYPLPSNNSNLPCDNNNNGMGPRCGGSEDATNGNSEDAALVASYSAAFLSIPAIQPRALCVQRGRFGTAATHSASLSVYMSTWGALQPTTNNNNTDSEPVSMMVSPSAVADGAVTRKKSFPSTTSSQSSTTTTPPPSIKAQYFHSHPTPMAKIREVADADMIVDTPPTSPTDPRDRLETMRDKRVNAAEDRLPCFTDYEEALSFVKRAKEEIGPNFGFSFALRELNTLYGFKDLLGSD